MNVNYVNMNLTKTLLMKPNETYTVQIFGVHGEKIENKINVKFVHLPRGLTIWATNSAELHNRSTANAKIKREQLS